MPTGHLTREQLLRLWIDSVDPEYARGVLSDPDSAAAIEQLCEIFALVSLSAEETTQEMYLLSGSGQSAPPAGGAALAVVTLTVERSRGFERLLVFEPGTLVEEAQIDAGPDGGVEHLTARRYALAERVVFFPGEAGPFEVLAVAERAGRGFDHPAPGSIRSLRAPGKGFANDEATVTPGAPGPHVLTAAPRPDAPLPEHVGQTVELVVGANVGQRRRIVGYARPTPPVDAGGFLLARDALLRLTGAIAGDFEVGEGVTVPTGRALLLAIRHPWALVERLDDEPTAAGTMTGEASGATVTFDVESDETMTAEGATAGWRVIDATGEFGVAFSNEQSPSGGRDAVLDSLAFERGTLRAPGEVDELLRERAADPADAISPGAVRRAANRVLVPFGAEAMLREAGRPEFPGMYLDVDALDLDGVAIAGGPTGFEGGELVFQESTLARGVAIVQSPAGLGPVSTPVLVGISRVRGTFASGQPIVGSRSGATVAAPAFSGGLRPEDVHRVAFSYADARAYFLISTSHRGQGDFGCAFDSHPFGFCDSAPALSFFDGFAATSAAAAQRVWQAVDEVRAGGVGFSLIEEAPPA